MPGSTKTAFVGTLNAIVVCAAAAFAGDETCGKCHPNQVRTFRSSGMGRSIVPASEVRDGAAVAGPAGITYRVAVVDGRVNQESLRGGSVLESHRLIYGIGSGEHGTSYVVSRGDALFLAPLSYYTSKAMWDLSPGFQSGAYRDFLRPVNPSCLFCHATLPEAQAISCERCHGPGEAHAKQPAAAIVNPAKLPWGLRDDVCLQCHLGGDLRIAKPGHAESDFRPGMRLQDIVAVFSLPPAVKPEGLDAVGQASQLRMSRCWRESAGRLGCATCHDPHTNRTGAAAAAYYRSRCESCHATRRCTASAGRRNATSPPNDCASCHMPKNPLNRIGHIAHTNHRILRRPELALDPSAEAATGVDLVYENGGEPDSRSRALAYAQAALGLPQYINRANRLLDEALIASPRDAELLGAAGLLRRDTGMLRGAAELGLRSAQAGAALCELEQTIEQCRAAVEQVPYDPALYVRLIGLYVKAGERDWGAEWLGRLRALDPANPEIAGLDRRLRGLP